MLIELVKYIFTGKGNITQPCHKVRSKVVASPCEISAVCKLLIKVIV